MNLWVVVTGAVVRISVDGVIVNPTTDWLDHNPTMIRRQTSKFIGTFAVALDVLTMTLIDNRYC
jgi:hypothetical protein